jgi:hypothetical protein
MSDNDKTIIFKTKYKYKKKPIGEGSFAKVFLAINSNGDKFALKRKELERIEQKREAKQGLLNILFCPMICLKSLKNSNSVFGFGKRNSRSNRILEGTV